MAALFVDLKLGQQAVANLAQAFSIVSGCRSGNGIAPPARLSWPPAVPWPLTTSRRTSPEWPPRCDARIESFKRFSKRPIESDQLTRSKRMKKSATSAMMSG